MRFVLASLVFAAALAAAGAHEPRLGPNGGQLVDAGARYHVELIATDSDEVVLILSDVADKPVPAAGFKANAILVVGGKPQRFPLAAGEGSRLVGKAPVPVPKGVKGAIQLIAPDGATSQAKF